PKQLGRNNMHGPIPADPLIQNRPRTIHAATYSADPLEIEILTNIDPKVGNSIATTEGELGGREINNTYLEGMKIVEEEANRNMPADDMQQNYSASTPISIPIATTSSRHAETTLNCIRKKSKVGENAQLGNTSGICFMRDLVCLVIDEAHRASGNYSYCVVVRELMAFHVQVRILALTATPGSKRQAVQKVIDNLQISTLEYRNETDPDVLPYVHARKIEQITVPMGQDAIEVGELLFEVMDPLVTRLRAYGLPVNRDRRTLSPHLILDSRSRFREAPPQNLPQVKFQEIDGLYGVLITLSHIVKLLSSHGIKSAFEMLEEKLQSKLFGRLMGRNEILLKVKRLMQQVVSHGAPSPKLSKMLEILIDHYKMSDPKKSRVIIFSNFRQSVSDILLSLRSLMDLVKATEFIGQSSGKMSKGQSQKNQQAVLEKFRTGEYNVIVATSIGEEGLDIMEVDLVVCFDANISPLRMIQRMGRTGRKHEGRVDILFI
ncbi:hypothetical protein HAX54_051179, partial [Datura stramonium]|nr:hypothetical protein [Datura stramonium]